jgi:hypothetical protein
MSADHVERAVSSPGHEENVHPRLGLRRDSIDPDPTVTAMRDRHATCAVTTHLGLRATLVAGYEEARRSPSPTPTP